MRQQESAGIVDAGQLVWLQTEPDATSKVLMARLQAQHPERFSGAQLRTMQRRVKEWLGSPGVNQFFGHGAEPFAEPIRLPELALIGVDPKC